MVEHSRYADPVQPVHQRHHAQHRGLLHGVDDQCDELHVTLLQVLRAQYAEGPAGTLAGP